MDPQTLLGMILTFVFAIVVTTAISRLGLKMLGLRERRMELQAGAGATDHAAKTEQLEKRVRVLERIATERGYDVATQIEALRDQRGVDEAKAGVSIEPLKRERA